MVNILLFTGFYTSQVVFSPVFLHQQYSMVRKGVFFYETFDADSGAVPGGSGVMFHQQVPKLEI